MKFVFYFCAAIFGFFWGYYCFALSDSFDDCVPKLGKKFQVAFSLIIAFGVIWSVSIYRPYEQFCNRSYVVQKEPKYEAIIGNKVEKYIKCYNKNGHNICEADDEEFVVEDYWKIEE